LVSTSFLFILMKILSMKFTELSVTISKYFITKLHIYDVIFYMLYCNDIMKRAIS